MPWVEWNSPCTIWSQVHHLCLVLVQISNTWQISFWRSSDSLIFELFVYEAAFAAAWSYRLELSQVGDDLSIYLRFLIDISDLLQEFYTTTVYTYRLTWSTYGYKEVQHIMEEYELLFYLASSWFLLVNTLPFSLFLYPTYFSYQLRYWSMQL